jgi:hypothetical protein
MALPPNLTSMAATMAVRGLLQHLGLTDDEAVRFLDAFTNRGLVLGYLLEDGGSFQLYACRSLSPDLPEEARSFTIRVNKRKEP